MFKKAKNLDTAFKDVRRLAMLIIVGCVLICGFALYKSFSLAHAMQNKIYVLANGKALEAYAAERRDNVPVEARDHIRTFHQLFFNLDPDDKLILSNIGKALYLADNSGKREYDNLKEQNYYSNIISGNVSQRIQVDSISLNLESHPYQFRCVASLSIIRSTTIAHRSLVTEGYLRNVSRSDNNSHGFLIEQWKIVENKDVSVQQRQ